MYSTLDLQRLTKGENIKQQAKYLLEIRGSPWIARHQLSANGGYDPKQKPFDHGGMIAVTIQTKTSHIVLLHGRSLLVLQSTTEKSVKSITKNVRAIDTIRFTICSGSSKDAMLVTKKSSQSTYRYQDIKFIATPCKVQATKSQKTEVVNQTTL